MMLIYHLKVAQVSTSQQYDTPNNCHSTSNDDICFPDLKALFTCLPRCRPSKPYPVDHIRMWKKSIVTVAVLRTLRLQLVSSGAFDLHRPAHQRIWVLILQSIFYTAAITVATLCYLATTTIPSHGTCCNSLPRHSNVSYHQPYR